MKDNIRALFFIFLFLTTACKMHNQPKTTNAMTNIDPTIQQMVVDSLFKKYPDAEKVRIEAGVKQTAYFWRAEDGTPEAFKNFCLENFTSKTSDLDSVFNRISRNLEIEKFFKNAIIIETKINFPKLDKTEDKQ